MHHMMRALFLFGLLFAVTASARIQVGQGAGAFARELDSIKLAHLKIEKESPRRAFEIWKQAVADNSKNRNVNVVIKDASPDTPATPVILELKDISSLHALKFLGQLTGGTVKLERNVVLVELP